MGRLIGLVSFIVSFSLFASDDTLTKKTEAYANTLSDKINLLEKRAKSNKQVKDIKTIISSKEFKKRVTDYQDSANALLNSDVKQLEDKEKETLSNMGDRVLLFVSSSMPIDTLRNYAKDLNKINGIMVFRGFIGGVNRVIPTQNFIKKIITKNTKCDTISCDSINLNVAFDPNRFLSYGIKKVPALVYENNVNMAANCDDHQLPKPENIIYGDASLKGMLIELYRITSDNQIKSVADKLH